jgi:hypothetical protein
MVNSPDDDDEKEEEEKEKEDGVHDNYTDDDND